MRALCAIACILASASAEISGCVVDPNAPNTCHMGIASGDSTSLLQLAATERMQEGSEAAAQTQTAALTQRCSDGGCKFSEWSTWSACSKSCGSGTQTRSRTVVSGTTCAAACLEEAGLCHVDDCAATTTTTPPGPTMKPTTAPPKPEPIGGSCTVTLFRDEKCAGESKSFQTKQSKGQEFQFNDDHWYSASIKGNCDSVEFYDEDKNRRGYADNMHVKGTTDCHEFPWDLDDDISGLFIIAASQRPPCTVTLFRDEECKGESKIYQTKQAEGQEFTFNDDHWYSARVQGNCKSVEFYDEDKTRRGYSDNIFVQGTADCKDFPYDLDNDMAGLYIIAFAPIDCALSTWGDWSACSATCGNGTKTRSRTVTADAQHGGTCNVGLDASEECKEKKCPIPPALFKSQHDGKCLDYHMGSTNVYMHGCHGGKNQKWYLEGELFKSQHDGKCLDYNFNNGNVYMHGCHGGNNQKWYLEGGQFKSRHDSKCLDYNFNNGNVYMHGCHGGNNQKWEFR